MPADPTIQAATWALSVFALAAAGFRLYSDGLIKRFRFFFFYLCLSVSSAVVLYFVGPPNSILYMSTWATVDPLLQVAMLLSVAELIDQIFSQYPRLGRFGTVILAVTTVFSLTLCFGTATGEMQRLDSRSWFVPMLKSVFLTHRWIHTIGLIALLSVGLFLARFRRPVSPLIVRHGCIMAAYLAVNSLTFLLLAYFPRHHYILSPAELALSAFCGFAWTLLLRRAVDAAPPAGTSLEELDAARQAHTALLDQMRRIR